MLRIVRRIECLANRLAFFGDVIDSSACLNPHESSDIIPISGWQSPLFIQQRSINVKYDIRRREERVAPAVEYAVHDIFFASASKGLTNRF